MRIGISGAPYPVNQYSTKESGGNDGWSDTTGKTSELLTLTGGETTLLFIVAGQSNAGNHGSTTPSAPGSYTILNPSKIQNLNIYDGLNYRLTRDMALGCTGNAWNWMGNLGDKLIAAGNCARVIYVPCAVAGSTIAMWGTGVNAVCRNKLEVAIKRARTIAMPVSGILWQQGESDNGSTQAAYEAGLVDLMRVAQGRGCFAPLFLAKSSYQGGAATTNIRNAIDAMVASNPSVFKAGPDTDTLTGASNRTGDNTHLTIEGMMANATLWQTALDAVF